jgi:hypothetical protein
MRRRPSALKTNGLLVRRGIVVRGLPLTVVLATPSTGLHIILMTFAVRSSFVSIVMRNPWHVEITDLCMISSRHRRFRLFFRLRIVGVCSRSRRTRWVDAIPVLTMFAQLPLTIAGALYI